MTEGFVWWRGREGRVCDPYDLLPPMFCEFSREEQAALDEALSSSLQQGVKATPIGTAHDAEAVY